MQAGAGAAGFHLRGAPARGAAGEWRVVADPTAASGRAIAQTEQGSHRLPLPARGLQTLSGEGRRSRRCASNRSAATVDQAGGIAVRLSTPDDYYVVRANALENNVRFYRVVKGKREQLGGANAKVAANQWHTLALQGRGRPLHRLI